MMRQTKIKRIARDLDEAIEQEYKENSMMGKLAAQVRIVNIWREAKKNFAIPRGVIDIDLTKCHLKRKK